jgi:hypothetical protein
MRGWLLRAHQRDPEPDAAEILRAVDEGKL